MAAYNYSRSGCLLETTWPLIIIRDWVFTRDYVAAYNYSRLGVYSRLRGRL